MKKLFSLILALTLLLSVALPALSVPAAAGYNLSAVTNLRISTEKKAKRLVLRWDDVDDAEGYQILRSTTGKAGSYKLISEEPTPIYVDEGLKSSKVYYYAVRPWAWDGTKCIYGPYKKINLSTRISKSYALKRLMQAWVAMDQIWASIEHPEDAFEPPMGIGTYYPITFKGYTTQKQLNAYLRKYFSKSVISGKGETIDEYFMEKDGQLYAATFMEMDLDAKRDVLINEVRLGKLRYTDKTVTFSASIPYRKANGTITYTDDYSPFALTYESGRWVISQPDAGFWCYWKFQDRD